MYKIKPLLKIMSPIQNNFSLMFIISICDRVSKGGRISLSTMQPKNFSSISFPIFSKSISIPVPSEGISSFIVFK